jgi:hypothetical protein
MGLGCLQAAGMVLETEIQRAREHMAAYAT